MRKTHKTKALVAAVVSASVLLTTPVWAADGAEKKDTKEKYKVGLNKIAAQWPTRAMA